MKNLAFHSFFRWNMIIYYYIMIIQFSLPLLYISLWKGWENVHFELESERVNPLRWKKVPCRTRDHCSLMTLWEWNLPEKKKKKERERQLLKATYQPVRVAMRGSLYSLVIGYEKINFEYCFWAQVPYLRPRLHRTELVRIHNVPDS